MYSKGGQMENRQEEWHTAKFMSCIVTYSTRSGHSAGNLFLNHCIADDDKEPSAVSLDFPPSAPLPMQNDIDS